MQIKNTYQLTPVRMAKIRKKKRHMLVEIWKKGNPCILFVVMQVGTEIMKTVWRISEN